MTRLEFAQKAVVMDGDRILLVRKSDQDPYHPGKWELPGGRMKESDDLDTHLVREVFEETGLTVTVAPDRPIDIWLWHMAWHGEPVRVVAFSRYCRLAKRAALKPQRECDDFLSEQRWVPRDELPSLDIIPSQRPTIELVAKEAASCRPAFE
jgi:8-oxo-dGTP pyrophosphatase MutT (NUDIX family)